MILVSTCADGNEEKQKTLQLDARQIDNSWQIIQIFRKLNAFGATVIITTHDEQLVRRCNHRVVQVCNGKLLTKNI